MSLADHKLIETKKKKEAQYTHPLGGAKGTVVFSKTFAIITFITLRCHTPAVNNNYRLWKKEEER